MKQHPTAQLRALVKRGKFLELPAAFDPLTARLIKSAGFEAVYNGGFVTGSMTAIAEPLLAEAQCVAARKNVEDLIGLDDYYEIERATVEKAYGKKRRGSRR